MKPEIDHQDSPLARVAHELSQPLSAIVAATRVLRSSGDPGAVDRAGAVIEHQMIYMQSLVNDLLADARQHCSQMLVRYTRLDVREVVKSVLDANEAVCAKRQLTTTAELPDGPVWVDGDAVRLQEILWNLMSNAVRHTPRGGTIAVDVTPHDDIVIIAVRDTGSGLERREIRRIFRAFVQGECGTPDGLGLGLAVAWDLARSHGGTIDVRSEGRGRGSEFRVVLPSSV